MFQHTGFVRAPRRAAASAIAALIALGPSTAVLAGADCTAVEALQYVSASVNWGDRFGNDIDSDGNRLIVARPGRWFDDHAAHVYDIDPETGYLLNEVILVPEDVPVDVPDFLQVAIDGDIALLGFPDAEGPDGQSSCGEVFVFEHVGGEWIEQATLLPPEPDHGLYFGWSLEIADDRIAVGAIGDDVVALSGGAVVLFERDGGAWSFVETVRPEYLQPGGSFGSAVDIEGDRLAVGATGGQPGEGRAYVFEHTGEQWMLTASLQPTPEQNEGGYFGVNLDLADDALIVGHFPDPGEPIMGAAFIYRYDDDTAQWDEQQRLQPDDANDDAEFGVDVLLDGDVAYVGAPWAAVDGVEAGAVYRFTRSGPGWIESGRFGQFAPQQADHVGGTIAVAQSWLYAGAPGTDVNESLLNRGSVFIFDATFPCPAAEADLNGDGEIDVGDLLVLLAFWGPCGGCDADLDGSGVVDVDDLLDLLNLLS